MKIFGITINCPKGLVHCPHGVAAKYRSLDSHSGLAATTSWTITMKCCRCSKTWEDHDTQPPVDRMEYPE